MSNKIMVVDDNSATRRAVRNALQRHGHDVIEAPDGKTARELMRMWQPRVVLQDLMLPDADGFMLVGELRKIAAGHDVSILAFSGFVSELLESRVSTVEFDDIITKPIAPSRLVPIIEAHLPISTVRMGGTADRFGASRRVVLADDDPMQLKLATFRLSRLGFIVDSVRNGREALVAIRAKRPDIIVSDVMMPELDGFALAIELRKDPAYREVPLLLVTSTYVETSDRDLAKRVGANDLIHRTPDLAELVEALRTVVAVPVNPPEIRPETIPELEREHTQRVFRQLERQVRLNSGLAKRCSALASELAVLSNISDTILQHRDLPQALDEVLADCFDAGGIAGGAIFLLSEGVTSIQQVGGGHPFPDHALRTLFDHPELLAEVIERGATLVVPAGVSAAIAEDLLERAGATSMMVVPLSHGDTRHGALLMYARARELELDDWRAFGHGVATQIGQVIELSRAYDARLAAEQRATSHAALLTAIVESAPDIIMQVDLDGVIRFANKRIRSLPVAQVIGQNWFGFLDEPQRAIIRKAFDESIATAQPTEVEQSFAVGTYSLHFGPVIEHGKVTGIVVVARDVSERKQTEVQLVLADRMASVGTLAAGVAHEINNPLASVIANLDLATTDLAKLGETVPLPSDLVEEIRDARLGAERVRDIVRDLKIFSRAEEDTRGPLDVEQVLDSTLRMAWTELRHRARVVKQYTRVPRVDANDSRLGQVFLNLMINAAHAIEEGNYEANEILIRTEHRGDNVIVTIADTGAGIDPEIRGRLFTPFFTTKPAGVGTGLGLAISLKIVASFGGTLTFDSEVGRGTAFHVSLPALADAVVAPVVAQVRTRPLTERRGKILVIDDDVQLAQAIRRYLAPNHDVTVVHSGRAGLRLFEQGVRFDVILCDVMMPQVTGMELFRRIAEVDPAQAAKIVFLTGGAFTISAREFLDATKNARVEKPFDLKALRRLVNDLIR